MSDLSRQNQSVNLDKKAHARFSLTGTARKILKVTDFCNQILRNQPLCAVLMHDNFISQSAMLCENFSTAALPISSPINDSGNQSGQRVLYI